MRRFKTLPLRGEARTTNEYIFNQDVSDFATVPINHPVDTAVERPSADGRRVHTEVLAVPPPSPVKRARTQASAPHPIGDNPPAAAPEAAELYDMDLQAYFSPPSPPKKKKKTFKPSDRSLFDFRPLRDEYLHELLRLDGCGDASEDICPGCGTPTPTIRCLDCHDDALYCAECCKAAHARNPLHRVQSWDGRFFQRTSLKALGLRIQFGHAGCTRPRPGHQSFVVLDVSGIHEVAVDFCACELEADMGHPRVQLLRRRWFPATHDHPRSAATFRLLDHFQTLTLQAKTTMYDFYSALERLTDGAGDLLLKRYVEFLRMTRAFRHLMMLKRGGRGHAVDGVDATTAGELAIRCPACPRPGINLPDDWESAPPEKRFLYLFFLALDACFRLKRRLISSALRDPGLGTGWSYFVEPEPYRKYLLSVTKQDEMSTCSGLAALDYANTKFSRGYSVTGVGMGVCARHEFVQPTGVGDLQKGERYSNMDYIAAAILRWIHERLRKVVSYDIVCQWFKNLRERLRELPPLVRLHVVLALYVFVIPKLHIHAHTLACQLIFSLNFVPGAGQTDGEGIERPWANLGGVASSTREMGPGSRADVLDDHFAFWNWSKLIHIGALLRKRLDKAKLERDVQCESFNVFSTEQAARVPAWEKLVSDYEKDPRKKNPYEITTATLKEADVRLRLAGEESASLQRGVLALHDVSPSSFIFEGLDLEDQQRRIRAQVQLKKAGTTAQQIDIIAMRRKLSCGIARFRKLQATYTPGALQALARRDASPEEVPEKTPLMLPSALSAAERDAGCIGGVQIVENMARDAQCSEALMRLRNQLHIKSRFFTYKELHVRNQGANTRARNLVARNESKILLHSEKYQAAWEALRALNGGTVGWRKLRREDVRTMEDPEELTKQQATRRRQASRRREKLEQLRREGEYVTDDEEEEGEGNSGNGGNGDVGRSADDVDVEMVTNPTENRRVVSWIWQSAGTTGTDAELEDALRIEWTKARARARRWTEEVELLEEEYRWVLISFEHEAQRWETRATEVPVGTVEVGYAQGAIAYALKQAATYRALASRVTVSMTELHRGRGRKRVPAAPGNGGDEEGTDEEEGDSEEEGGEANAINSDEEFFLGGEDEGE
ncbi:CxC2 domain-containing protein [Favolaschia claudopus]|uniref:CxC2 domain-containing protein n=1 Tax=Favolaschia claudopus TaxID=2862362 RepID=A0AAV9ZU62_9AGAR